MAYHHGNLRAALLVAAATAVAADGVGALSLRKLASQLGVSHAAPRHHFGDKRGVITALATQGYDLLAEALRAAGEDFLEAGVAYVRFALEHPGHFAVMYRPDLVNADDPELLAARGKTGAALVAASTAHARKAGRAASEGPILDGRIPPLALLGWAAAHGLSHLASIGALDGATGSDLDPGTDVAVLTRLARRTLRELEPT